MSFSTSFCLTNTGNLPSNTTLSFYSNVDGYTVPFQTTVPLFSVTGNNCPYILTGVPDGTQTIKVESSTGNCCAVINITPNDPCTFCDLGFDSFLSTTIGQIVAGNLTGSCDASITDYQIEWYDVTNSNSPVLKFTTGAGIIFPYTYQHPLVNTTAITPVLPGLYKPFLRRVIINGITYTYDGIPGTVQASLDCFSTVSVNVSPLNCSNGTEEGDYSHLLEFSGASNNVQPIPLSTIFQLSADTNYLAWEFTGYDIADQIKITYYGSQYNNTPIILEWFSIGNNNSEVNLQSNVFPKIIRTLNNEPYTKVTNLTELNISENDYLIIEIIPNIQNNKTNFKLKLQCLTTFNCETCFDNYFDSGEYKIIESSISISPSICNQQTTTFFTSGCSRSDVSNSDIYKYMNNYNPFGVNSGFEPPVNGQNLALNTFVWDKSQCGNAGLGFNTTCSIPPTTLNTNIITFNKDNSGPGGKGNIYMTFSNVNDFNAYYNDYLYNLSQLYAQNGIPTDPTLISWYCSMSLTTPVPNNENDPCGDTTSFRTFSFHPTSIVTTGFTNSVYTLNITMPTITKQMVFTNCQLYCDGAVSGVVNLINSSSTGSTNNFSYINNIGNRYESPFSANYTPYQTFSVTASTIQNIVLSYSKFNNETKPFSANTNGTYSYIPSLSATTCGFSDFTFQSGYPGANDDKYLQVLSYYVVELTNPLNVNDFVIKTAPITQGMYTSLVPPLYPWFSPQPTPNSLITIYQNLNGVGTVLQPSYFI